MHHEVCAVKVSGSKQNTFIVWLQVFAISLFLSIANFTKLQNKTTTKKKKKTSAIENMSRLICPTNPFA